jgi:hypothetical protein
MEAKSASARENCGGGARPSHFGHLFPTIYGQNDFSNYAFAPNHDF